MFRLVLGLVAFCGLLGAAPFSSLHFFGDSLTDSGNVYRVTSALNTYTLGLIPKVPDSPYYQGRFTNGPVWAEHTAWRLGRLEDAAPGGMSLGLFGSVDGPGNNYAVGGARTDGGGALGLLDLLIPTGVETQVQFYLQKTGASADPDGLYFLEGGGNDLRDAARISDPQQRQLAAEGAATNLLESVVRLYAAGARNFMLMNAPNIGWIPESLSAGVTQQGLEVSQYFNATLDANGPLLRTLPGLSLDYFDLFGVHNSLVSYFGIGTVAPCIDGPPGRCSETLFFDAVHPTANMHQYVGYAVADQILAANSVAGSLSRSAMAVSVAVSGTPEPGTAGLLLAGAALVAVVRWRRGAITP